MAYAQSDAGAEVVAHGFSIGNTELLSDYLPDIIDLEICGHSNVYSRTQAIMVMKDFFKKNPVDECRWLRSKSQNGHQPIIMATLRSEDKHYRLGYRLSEHGGQLILRSIRISEIH